MVVVETLTGKRFNIESTSKTVVFEIKEAIMAAYKAEGTHMPVEYQRLVAPGQRILANNKTLGDYGISGSTIITLLRWREA